MLLCLMFILTHSDKPPYSVLICMYSTDTLKVAEEISQDWERLDTTTKL